MSEFSNKLDTSGRKFKKQKSFLKNQWKSHFLRKIKRKAFFLKKSKVKFLISSKNQLKNMFFLPRKCIDKKSHAKVWRKFGESFTETFGGHPKVSAKLSVKLSLAIRKFHETFGGQMKVSWNFRWPKMKLSYGERKFQSYGQRKRKFHWNFRMATESFSETFAKLSSNFRMTLFSMHFLGKQIMFFSFFFAKKWEISPWIFSKNRFSLEFSSKNGFFLDLSKRCFLFYWNFLPEVN